MPHKNSERDNDPPHAVLGLANVQPPSHKHTPAPPTTNVTCCAHHRVRAKCNRSAIRRRTTQTTNRRRAAKRTRRTTVAELSPSSPTPPPPVPPTQPPHRVAAPDNAARDDCGAQKTTPAGCHGTWSPCVVWPHTLTRMRASECGARAAARHMGAGFGRRRGRCANAPMNAPLTAARMPHRTMPTSATAHESSRITRNRFEKKQCRSENNGTAVRLGRARGELRGAERGGGGSVCELFFDQFPPPQ